MTANRSNRRWQNPIPAEGEKPAFPLGSQRANSPSWSRARGTTQRPDTREQSNLPPEVRPLANEEESIHAGTSRRHQRYACRPRQVFRVLALLGIDHAEGERDV